MMVKTKENSKVESVTTVSDTMMNCSLKIMLTVGVVIGIVSITSLVVATVGTGGLVPMIGTMVSIL